MPRVSAVRQHAAVGDLLARRRAGRQLDEAVGDAGQADGADARDGAAAQRRQLVVGDVELEVGQAVVGELDLLDLADDAAADLDQAALDELAGVDEARVDACSASRRRGCTSDGDHARRRARRWRRARRHPPIGARGLPPQNSCVPSIPIAWMPRMLTTIDCAVALPTPTGPPPACSRSSSRRSR